MEYWERLTKRQILKTAKTAKKIKRFTHEGGISEKEITIEDFFNQIKDYKISSARKLKNIIYVNTSYKVSFDIIL